MSDLQSDSPADKPESETALLIERLRRPMGIPPVLLYCAAANRLAALEAALTAKQARIDELMLEFCPDEMTTEQKAEWARHQRPAREGSRNG